MKSEPAEGVVAHHVKGVQESLLLSPHHHTDHDYTAIYGQNIKLEPGNPGKAWIDEDAPPLGYGSGLKEEELMMTHRHMNVNVTSSGQGTRTVVLQIPRDIK